jgi:hypothetical protein
VGCKERTTIQVVVISLYSKTAICHRKSNVNRHRPPLRLTKHPARRKQRRPSHRKATSTCRRTAASRCEAFGARTDRSFSLHSEITVNSIRLSLHPVSHSATIALVLPKAKVAKLADAPDLGSGGATRGGSSPPFRTNNLGPILESALFTCAQYCAHPVSKCALRKLVRRLLGLGLVTSVWPTNRPLSRCTALSVVLDGSCVPLNLDH